MSSTSFENASSNFPLIVALTGATGMYYGIDLLRALKELNIETHLILSEWAERVITMETDTTVDEVRDLADVVYGINDMAAPVSSGSFRTRGMIVAPCTIKTLSGIANSYTDNLIIRAADVCLKENRKLVLMVRETPLHSGHLDLMGRAMNMGATILPPVPAFYHRPESVQDMINQSVGKVLDQFGIDHNLFQRWSGEMPAKKKDPTAV